MFPLLLGFPILSCKCKSSFLEIFTLSSNVVLFLPNPFLRQNLCHPLVVFKAYSEDALVHKWLENINLCKVELSVALYNKLARSLWLGPVRTTKRYFMGQS